MLLRRIARPLLAGIFVYGGVAALRDPEAHAKAAQPVLDQVADRMPVEDLPSSLTLVRLDAGIKIGAGVLFGLGKAPRVAAAALAASLVPTTMAAHRFWEIKDPERRQAEQVQFLKNLGLLGGLMLASADTEGKPSLAWRARRAGRTSGATAELFHRDLTAGLGELAERASRTRGQAVAAAGHAGGRLSEVAGELSEKAGPSAARLREVAGQAGERAGAAAAPAAARLGGHTHRLLGEADKRGSRAAKRARKARKRAGKRLEQVSKQADKRIRLARKRAAKRAERIRASIGG
jgi:uncharacterized membrane protein YphA (DoxX/SURF4 family)